MPLKYRPEIDGIRAIAALAGTAVELAGLAQVVVLTQMPDLTPVTRLQGSIPRAQVMRMHPREDVLFENLPALADVTRC